MSLSNDLVKPLLAKDYSLIHEIEADICHVSKSLISIAHLTIPNSRPPNQGNHRIKYNICPPSAGVFVKSSDSGRQLAVQGQVQPNLSTLCWRSREVFRQQQAVQGQVQPTRRGNNLRGMCRHIWKNAEPAPSTSPSKIEMKPFVHDTLNISNHIPGGSSLIMNGCVVTDPQHVLHHWVDHFTTLGKSQCPTNSLLQETQSRIPEIEAQSYTDSKLIVDLPFLPEEVEAAIKHLKRNSSDSITPHHLLHTGSIFKDWLCHIFNKIVELESIPASFKVGTIIPTYRIMGNFGGGFNLAIWRLKSQPPN